LQAQDVTRDVQEEKPELLQDLGKFVANMDQKLLELPEVAAASWASVASCLELSLSVAPTVVFVLPDKAHGLVCTEMARE
jgi:hypothetical protein